MAKKSAPKKGTGTRTKRVSSERATYESLAHAHGVLSEGVQALCRKNGLSALQHNVLEILRRSEDQETPTSSLIEKLVGRISDGTRLIDRLETAGLVRRRQTPEDRRVVLVKLSAKGRRLLEKLDGQLSKLHAGQLGKLKKTEQAQLRTLLEKLAG